MRGTWVARREFLVPTSGPEIQTLRTENVELRSGIPNSRPDPGIGDTSERASKTGLRCGSQTSPRLSEESYFQVKRG
jgi:hypothetical protein